MNERMNACMHAQVKSPLLQSWEEPAGSVAPPHSCWPPCPSRYSGSPDEHPCHSPHPPPRPRPEGRPLERLPLSQHIPPLLHPGVSLLMRKKQSVSGRDGLGVGGSSGSRRWPTWACPSHLENGVLPEVPTTALGKGCATIS